MSSGIWQRGKEEGVYGFLIEDIRKEVTRASKLVSKLLYSLYHKYCQYLRKSFPSHSLLEIDKTLILCSYFVKHSKF